MNGGRSGQFSITEDSAGLATPSAFSGMSKEQKAPLAGTEVSPARDPFFNLSGMGLQALLRS